MKPACGEYGEYREAAATGCSEEHAARDTPSPQTVRDEEENQAPALYKERDRKHVIHGEAGR